jgi:hypothetical protein
MPCNQRKPIWISGVNSNRIKPMAEGKHKSSGRGSKNKGSNFERKICRQLSLWWAGRDDIFWRTAGSGARATVRAKRKCSTANSAGDICALDHGGKPFTDHFLVELKIGYSKGGGIDVLKLLDSANSKKGALLLQWWLKAKKEMKFARRKEIWIIFQRDRGKPILMTRGDFIKMLDNRQGMGFPYSTVSTHISEAEFTFAVLDDFLSWYSPKQVII